MKKDISLSDVKDKIKDVKTTSLDKDKIKKERRIALLCFLLVAGLIFLMFYIGPSNLAWHIIEMLLSFCLTIYVIVWSLVDAENMKVYEVWQAMTLQHRSDEKEVRGDKKLIYHSSYATPGGDILAEYTFEGSGPTKKDVLQMVAWGLAEADKRRPREERPVVTKKDEQFRSHG